MKYTTALDQSMIHSSAAASTGNMCYYDGDTQLAAVVLRSLETVINFKIT